MKKFNKFLVAFLLLTVTVACSSDPISLQPDTNELYSREFISEFGVPASGHDFSMATSAGLKVTSARGGHVTVTAEVDGKEYLFADLNVPAGTRAIPVTIPLTVSTLNVKTSLGTHRVATNALVNIDQAPAGSTSSRGDAIIVSGDDTTGLTYIEDGDTPYLVFNPHDFLKQHFLDHPLDGKTDYTDCSLNPFNNSYNGETGYSSNADITMREYYIFPIYWQKNTNGNKDYETYIFNTPNGENDIKSPHKINFGKTDETSVPFPELGYSTPDKLSNASSKLLVSIMKLKFDNLDNLSNYFTYADEDANCAYDINNIDNISFIISRGTRIKFDSDKPARFGIYVKSDIKSETDFSFSSSMPFYNTYYWGTNYYESTISNLFTASVSAQRFDVDRLHKLYIHDDDYKEPTFGSETTYFRGDYLYDRTNQTKDILGFSSPATKPGDTTPRQYGDVVFLIVPYNSGETTIRQHAEKVEPFVWTIAAEDLGGSLDWDFNDVVFSFTDVIQNLNSVNENSAITMLTGPNVSQSMRVITVKPLAAGGTMPVYITYQGRVKAMPKMPTTGDMTFTEANQAIIDYFYPDGKDISNVDEADVQTYILGRELHKWLGSSTHNRALNVDSSRKDFGAPSISFVIPTEEPLENAITHAAAGSVNNNTLYGFGILVDKDNELNIDAINDTDNGFKHIPSLTLGKGLYTIGGISDDKNLSAPQMILVDTDWEWPREGVRIDEAYTNFSNWVSSPSAYDWHSNKNTSKVTGK